MVSVGSLCVPEEGIAFALRVVDRYVNLADYKLFSLFKALIYFICPNQVLLQSIDIRPLF